jgi:2-iminobutanoate/2-iminopropanoate deaminase
VSNDGRRAVSTAGAPAAIGPYSQAIRSGPFLFVSGQVPLDPASGAMVSGGVEAQAHQALRNLGAILAAAGVSFDAVVKTTVYLLDLGDFEAVNRVYAGYFPSPAPARATMQVARLPRDARIEIDAIAAI